MPDLQVEWRRRGQLVRLARQSSGIVRRRAGLRVVERSFNVSVGMAALDRETVNAMQGEGMNAARTSEWRPFAGRADAACCASWPRRLS